MKRVLLIVATIGLAACSGSASDSEAGGPGGASTTVAPPQPAGDPVVVGDAANTPYNLSTASGGDVVAVAWNDYDEDAAEEAPFVATSTDGGERFGDPVALDADEPYAAYPQLAVAADGTILVGVTLYEDGEADGRAGLYRSTDEGRTFELAADLTDAPRVSFTDVGTSIAVSADGEAVLMAWTASDADGAAASVVAVRSSDGGETFGEPVTLADQGGIGRARAFVGGAGAGVVVTESVPLTNPPAPTPAQPNPITSTPVPTFFPVEGDGFGSGRPLTADAAADVAPGAASSEDRAVLAWWQQEEGEGAVLHAAELADEFDGAPVRSEPVVTPAPLEVAIDRDGDAWILTMEPPADPENPPAPLVLSVLPSGGDSEVVAGFAPEVTRSAEEYDLTPLPAGGVLVAWFDDGAITTQRVSG